jgi:hypothetical protein
MPQAFVATPSYRSSFRKIYTGGYGSLGFTGTTRGEVFATTSLLLLAERRPERMAGVDADDAEFA